LQIDADDFRVTHLAIENSAGPGAQALAIRVDGDRVAFSECHFIGYQDTILVNRGRQYFNRCRIDGAIDFIFGGATAYFEHCDIVCVGNGYVTAASTPAEQRYGLVFHDCTIRGANPEVRTYLGRPWRVYASTIFLNCDLGAVIRDEGWNDWSKPAAHATVRYAAAGNRGPGAADAHWPPWVHRLSPAEASAITRDAVLAGHDGWKPSAE
jgi:pectinesterase